MARDLYEPLTLEEAYAAAFLWFDHKGEPPEEISEPAHGSIHLITETTVARVREGESPADQASVLATLRSAPEGKRIAIFSTTGFTNGAITIAESQGIALYEFDGHGTAKPLTTRARSLQPETLPDPPYAPKVEEERDSPWADSRLPGQPASVPTMPAERQESESEAEPVAMATVIGAPRERSTPVPDDTKVEADSGWSDCPTCGATHFQNARFCRSCGTDLTTGAPHGRILTSGGHTLVCKACGSHDIAMET